MSDADHVRNRGGFSDDDFLFAVTNVDKALGSTATCLYLWLSQRNITGAYPGSVTMAKVLSSHRNTIPNAERLLEETGLLTISGSGQKKNYTLHVPTTRTKPQRDDWNNASIDTCRNWGLEAQIKAVLQDAPPKVEIAPVVGVQAPIQVVEQPAPAQPPVVVMSQPQLVVQEAQGTFQRKEEPKESAPVPAPEVKEKKSVMTQEMYAWFLASPDRVEAWLRFGSGAYLKTPEEMQGMPSQPTDWLALNPADRLYPYHKDWTFKHFLGYFWSGVCDWRASHGCPLTFPNWGRLSGDLRNFLKTTTHNEAFTHVWIVANYFDLIKWQIGRIGQDMILDETALSHSLIRQKAMAIRQHGQEWLDAQMDLMHQGQNPVAEHEE